MRRRSGLATPTVTPRAWLGLSVLGFLTVLALFAFVVLAVAIATGVHDLYYTPLS